MKTTQTTKIVKKEITSGAEATNGSGVGSGNKYVSSAKTYSSFTTQPQQRSLAVTIDKKNQQGMSGTKGDKKESIAIKSTTYKTTAQKKTNGISINELNNVPHAKTTKIIKTEIYKVPKSKEENQSPSKEIILTQSTEVRNNVLKNVEKENNTPKFQQKVIIENNNEQKSAPEYQEKGALIPVENEPNQGKIKKEKQIKKETIKDGDYLIQITTTQKLVEKGKPYERQKPDFIPPIPRERKRGGTMTKAEGTKDLEKIGGVKLKERPRSGDKLRDTQEIVGEKKVIGKAIQKNTGAKMDNRKSCPFVLGSQGFNALMEKSKPEIKTSQGKPRPEIEGIKESNRPMRKSIPEIRGTQSLDKFIEKQRPETEGVKESHVIKEEAGPKKEKIKGTTRKSCPEIVGPQGLDNLSGKQNSKIETIQDSNNQKRKSLPQNQKIKETHVPVQNGRQKNEEIKKTMGSARKSCPEIVGPQGIDKLMGKPNQEIGKAKDSLVKKGKQRPETEGVIESHVRKEEARPKKEGIKGSMRKSMPEIVGPQGIAMAKPIPEVRVAKDTLDLIGKPKKEIEKMKESHFRKEKPKPEIEKTKGIKESHRPMRKSMPEIRGPQGVNEPIRKSMQEIKGAQEEYKGQSGKKIPEIKVSQRMENQMGKPKEKISGMKESDVQKGRTKPEIKGQFGRVGTEIERAQEPMKRQKQEIGRQKTEAEGQYPLSSTKKPQYHGGFEHKTEPRDERLRSNEKKEFVKLNKTVQGSLNYPYGIVVKHKPFCPLYEGNLKARARMTSQNNSGALQFRFQTEITRSSDNGDNYNYLESKYILKKKRNPPITIHHKRYEFGAFLDDIPERKHHRSASYNEALKRYSAKLENSADSKYTNQKQSYTSGKKENGNKYIQNSTYEQAKTITLKSNESGRKTGSEAGSLIGSNKKYGSSLSKSEYKLGGVGANSTSSKYQYNQSTEYKKGGSGQNNQNQYGKSKEFKYYDENEYEIIDCPVHGRQKIKKHKH